MSNSIEIDAIDGGVTAPIGFSASGIHAGIKSNSLDMALISSDRPANVAGVFTTNKIQAAPVKLCKRKLASGVAQALIINSGNANACTGEAGMINADKMAAITADSLGIDEQLVFVCSTGTIGVPLPMDKIESGIKLAADSLDISGGDKAAHAIMTTDTCSKQIAVEFEIDGKLIKIGAMAKGSGMIEPNMATMLACICTDAVIDPSALQSCLQESVSKSFNKISVDGDQSTNDTVVFFANGAAGNNQLNENHPQWGVFADNVMKVSTALAMKIVKDGEGATKFVTVVVNGAVSDKDAQKATRAIANSLLVKTSWFGCDPNWGRIIDALGYSGADLKEELVDISYDDFMAVKGGLVVESSADNIQKVIMNDEFSVIVNLNMGDGCDCVYTCDCSHEYVSINSDYTS